MQKFYNSSIKECFKTLNSSEQGLNSSDVNDLALKYKKKQFKEKRIKNVLKKFLSQFSDLMVLILLISAIVSIVIGYNQNSNSEIIDGWIILGIVFVNATIGFIQELKAEKTMNALKKITEQECLVFRDGKIVKISSKKIYPGDVILLSTGCIIPADCRVIDSANLLVDESALTGESDPVLKDEKCILDDDVILSERKNMVYKGTSVIGGHGHALVVSIDEMTEIGKITKLMEDANNEVTPLQKNIKVIGKILTIFILLMAGITFLLEILARGNPMQAFLTAIAISVAAIPESLPAVITIIMSLGVFKLAKNRALVKKLYSVETLGCCDVICSDKTGTITQNKMTVQKIFCDLNYIKDVCPNNIFMSAILLCNDTNKTLKGYIGDPTEIALTNYAKMFNYDKINFCKTYKRLDEISFDSKRKLMSTLNDFNGEKTLFVKGAFDNLLNKCTKVYIEGKIFDIEKYKEYYVKANEQMANESLRVLGVAYKPASSRCEETDLILLGVVGMIDPPRVEVIDAVKKCKDAGIKPIMITGDHLNTAVAIAKQVGIAESKEHAITGRELDKLSDEQLLKVIDKITVYARVSPENKTRIVTLLKEKGHVVAMTGDGINDAPSIKNASIGIGMGLNGTDVAKEASDLIITDDNFATIVVAIEEGRKVYKNIQKTTKFLFSANMAEILSLFLTTIIFPKITFLLPVQILFVNLITDTLPAIALGNEKEDDSIMLEKPRRVKDGILGNGQGREMFFMGIIQTIIIISSFVIGLKFFSQEIASTMAFYTLNIIQLLFMFSVRSEKCIFKMNHFKNKIFNFALIFGFGLLLLIICTPIHNILGLSSLSFGMWIIIIMLSLLVIVVDELYKYFRKKAHIKL